MNLYQHTPRPKNSAGKAVALISLLLGAGLFMVSYTQMGAKFATLFQLLGIFFLTVAIYIASCYLLREFMHLVEENDKIEDETLRASEKCDLIIREVKGKRQIKVLHLTVSELTAVRVVDKANRKAVKAERKKKKSYRYNTEFCPAKELEIQAVYEGEEFSILIGYDEGLKGFLERYI